MMAGARMNTARNESPLHPVVCQMCGDHNEHDGKSSPGQGAQALRRRQLRFEAVHLAAKVVAAHRHVQAAHKLLAALLLACYGGTACGEVSDCLRPPLGRHETRRTEGPVGQEDQPRARAPHRPPGGCKLAQRRQLRAQGSGLRSWAHAGPTTQAALHRLRTRFHRSAISAMVVLSPPGMTRPCSSGSWSALRTCRDGQSLGDTSHAGPAHARRRRAQDCVTSGAHLHRAGTRFLQAHAVLAERALQSQHSHSGSPSGRHGNGTLRCETQPRAAPWHRLGDAATTGPSRFSAATLLCQRRPPPSRFNCSHVAGGTRTRGGRTHAGGCSSCVARAGGACMLQGTTPVCGAPLCFSCPRSSRDR